jgi:hypothetical protein
LHRRPFPHADFVQHRNRLLVHFHATKLANTVFFPDFFRAGAHHQALHHDDVEMMRFSFFPDRPFSRSSARATNSHAKESFIFFVFGTNKKCVCVAFSKSAKRARVGEKSYKKS